MATTTEPAWPDAERAQTLAQARNAVEPRAPHPDAAPAVRRAYHLRAAAVYDRVAKVDRDHQHETEAYAQCERKAAAKCE